MRRPAGWSGGVQKKRCDYCNARPAVWFWYSTHVAYRGPYRVSGNLAMNAATCPEHEGCENWRGLLALHPEGRVVRSEGAPA